MIPNFIIIRPAVLEINSLNAELNPICHLLALLAHLIFHVSRIRVKHSDGHSESSSFLVSSSKTCKIRRMEMNYKLKRRAQIISIQ